MTPFIGSLQELVRQNRHFRHVAFTGRHAQLALMCLDPGEESGEEMHPAVDQFFRIEEGEATFVFNGKFRRLVHAGDAVVVPAGTPHNVINSSPTHPVKLYTLYTSPQHPEGTLQRTRKDAEGLTYRRGRVTGRAINRIHSL